MCGIAGVLYRDPQRPAQPVAITAMCDAIVHRGPDDQGIFIGGPVGIGMRRLSIIDLAGGHQPMQTEDGRFTIVFNGEIYNHRELRRELESSGERFRTSSDTEVILRAYRRYGPGCLTRLNGMFAIAIWDSSTRSLFLARDRVGIKPLYLCDTGSALFFASEVKSLLTQHEVARELDTEALYYFLRYGYVPSSRSFLTGIQQLLPGHFVLTSSEGALQPTSYWSLDHAEEAGHTESEWAAIVIDELRAAVQRQLVSDVPLGAFLSGGLDSSSLVALMSEVSGTPVNTYSIGFGGEDRFHNELDEARLIATQFGTAHHEILVEPDTTTLLPRLVHHLDQPLADSSFLVTYLVSELARQSVKVIISGVGGDEIFGGYRRYLGPRLSGQYHRLPAPVRRLAARAAAQVPVDRGSWLKNTARLGRAFVTSADLPPYERYDHAVQMLGEHDVRLLCPGLPPARALEDDRRTSFEAVNTGDGVAPLLHMDLRTSLVDSLLLLTDRMTMATSLEARVPLLDHTLIETVARIPAGLKIRGTTLRYIQKRAMRGHLPATVFGRRKRGFGCPVGRWFRGELRQMLRDELSPSALGQSGLFDHGAVERMISEHEQYREDRSDILLSLLTFQLWQASLGGRFRAAVERPVGQVAV